MRLRFQNHAILRANLTRWNRRSLRQSNGPNGLFAAHRSAACLTRPEAVTTLDFHHLLVCIAVESAHASLEASRADGPRLPYAERLRIVQAGIQVPPRCHSQGTHARVLAIDTPR